MAISDPDVSSRDRAHTFACGSCREQVEQLSHIVKLARSAPMLDELTSPRSVVWDRIAAAVRDTPLNGDATAVEETVAVRVSTEPHRVETPSYTAHSLRPRVRNRSRNRLRDRLRNPSGRRTVPLALTSIVAAIALLVGIGGGIALIGYRSTPRDAVVAATTLHAFPNWPTAKGEAKVESTASGERELVVNISSASTSNGAFREVWIMSSSLKKLISLGVLVGDTGRFAMPADISMDAYPVVDVSEQLDNGSPEHSGNSIVRGTLS